jgi:chromosome segregation ATPase
MKTKHKLIQDFQFISADKKIFVLKSGTILEGYNYKLKSEIIPIDKDIVDSNPLFFELIDWKSELMSYMKQNKMPQPAQLGKKLIPFIEEMVLSSLQQNSGVSMDPSLVRDLEKREADLLSSKREIDRRELELDSRDRRIKDKEDDIEVRSKRVEKREDEYKSDLKNLDKKEDELRSKSRELSEKELDIQDKLQDLNEKERNLDRNMLTTSKEFDSKYTELQNKIDEDMKSVSQKEKDVEVLIKDIKSRESSLIQQESELSDRERNFEQRLEDVNTEEASLMKEKNELLTKRSELESWERRLIELENSLRTPPEAPSVAMMPK